MGLHPSRYPTLFGCDAGTTGAAVVVGVPYDRGTASTHAGCAGAPAALRPLSNPAFCRADLHGLYDHARRETLFPKGALSDVGDIRFRISDGDDAYLAQIAELTRLLVREGKRPLLLGGDHLITLAALRGVASAGGDVQVVQLDAHYDYEAIAPDERPTHASFIAHVMKEGLVRRVVQVGVRGLGWGPPEPPAGVVGARPSELASALLPGVPTYLTVDTDGFDPAVAGAVNFPEHEGLSLADLETVLAQIASVGSFVGADWTEYNPTLDTRSSVTGHFIVRGLAKILARLCARASVAAETSMEQGRC